MLCKDRLGYTGAQAPTERSLQKLQTHSYAHTEIFDITLLACFVNEKHARQLYKMPIIKKTASRARKFSSEMQARKRANATA